MKHLNLTIPDELYERYQRQKHRFNLSRLCADMLDTELTRLEQPESIFHCPDCNAREGAFGAQAGERAWIECINGHRFDPFTREVLQKRVRAEQEG